MRFAYLGPITAAGRPPADLTLSRVQLSKLFDQIAVATNDLRHKVTAALLCKARRFVFEKLSDRIFITGQQ
jgi:hypothetical protein